MDTFNKEQAIGDTNPARQNLVPFEDYVYWIYPVFGDTILWGNGGTGENYCNRSPVIKKFFFMKEIVLKGSMNYVLNGARVGVGLAFSVLVAAEMLGAYAGIGYRIFFLQSVYRIDRMIGYILILGIIGLIFDKLFLIFSKKITLWKNES